MVKWNEQWAEALTVLFLALGFLLALLLRSALFSYLTIILAGLLAGRVYYIKKLTEPIFPFVLIIVGFLLGYLLGSFWTSRGWSLFLFGCSFGLSYYLHLKKMVIIFKNENFFK